ncbi:hypothetical protein AG1IA_06179 [Rhizoctonia solani AG-1 IA]|uniref:Uncharacterized protein n=1 Tax=Thanatephorus cucumeris (strain AG1-IA) TaxID=983506 RepID=L8WNQ7_THACA|nr:hypothetical protein AG1IA_06179 [Rhizoctonia solani AG-1 IA]
MRKVTEKVLYQFSLSATSQSRLVLIAQLLGTLSKEWCLDEQGIIMLRLLRDGIFRDIIGCSPEYPVSGKAIQQANSALNNVLELVVIQVWTAPLSWTISLFRIASPVFPAACQYPLPPRFFDITLDSSLDLRHFAVVDVILSLVTGRATFCRYHRGNERQGNQGTEWIIGIPDQFLLVLAYMSGLRTVALEGTSHGDSVLHVQNNTNHRNIRSRKEGLIDPLLAQKLEGDLRRIRILPGQSKDPALCGAHAEDPRVQHSLKRYMRLVNGIRPGRNPDVFLFTPMVIAGVSAIKAKHRHTLTSRTLGLPEHSKPGTTGNDLVKILENVWNRTAMEGRSACWDDLSIFIEHRHLLLDVWQLYGSLPLLCQAYLDSSTPANSLAVHHKITFYRRSGLFLWRGDAMHCGFISDLTVKWAHSVLTIVPVTLSFDSLCPG